MAKAVHTMLRIFDEARSTDFYRHAFGLEIVDRFPFDDFTAMKIRAASLGSGIFAVCTAPSAALYSPLTDFSAGQSDSLTPLPYDSLRSNPHSS